MVHVMDGAAHDRLQQEHRKDVLIGPSSVYQPAQWGDKHNTTGCAASFWNFGQWPLSYVITTPWSPVQYAKAVESLAQHMLQQAPHGGPQFWLSINPFNSMGWKIVLEGRDWRTDPYLLLYNQIASSIMQAHGIPVVDTFRMMQSLADVSHDGAHFYGVVGFTQLRVLLTQALC
jgi:hypothetical protein